MKRISVPWLDAHYSKTEALIPMRDGARLYTAVYSPVNAEEKRPLLLVRSPFPLKPYGAGRYSSKLRGELAAYVSAGYIIALQNVRGTYLSEGRFENVSPADRSEETATTDKVPELTDSWDTAEWLCHNTECNGNIGVKGVSYPGFYAVCAAMCGHPAIKAVSPQAPVTDWFTGDDLHHNGALALNDVWNFGRFFFRERPRPGSRVLPTRREECSDIYRFFLKKGPLPSIFGPLAKKGGFWKDLVLHPDYDNFWKERDIASVLGERQIPGGFPAMLIVGGSFDAEDLHGPLACYESVSDRKNSYLVIGPWGHGSWCRRKFDHIAGAAMTDGLSGHFLDKIEFPFFEHFLEGKGEAPSGKVTLFPSTATAYASPAHSHSGRKSGIPAPIVSETWPPHTRYVRRLYFNEDGKLSSKPSRHGTLKSYLSDPSKPVPACRRAPYLDGEYMAADQSFVSRRRDVASFSTGRNREPMTVAGTVKVSLCVAASSDDADIVVKLIDVRPDGYKMLVRGEIMPLRYRDSLSDAKALPKNTPVRVTVDLKGIVHTILPGHRILVQIQSSWFPLFRANPQKYSSNPYTDFQGTEIASVSICTGDENPSYMELPVL